MRTIWKLLVGGLVAFGGLCLAFPQHVPTLEFEESLVNTAYADGHEVMTDRCSAEVAFPPSYNAKPFTHGTHVLKRGKDGWTGWHTFKAELGDDGHVRWWCHSTTGNVFDPGTWRIHIDAAGATACLVSAVSTVATDGTAAPTLASCEKAIKITSSAFDGWTAERSRCGDHSNKFRARLGPDRLLQTECLGRE